MGRVVVVTFDENEEEKLNELLHFLSAKKYSEIPGKQNRVLDYGALKINAEYRSVESNGELVQLTNYEFEILYLLAKNPGRIFSKEQIYTQVWKEPYYGAEDIKGKKAEEKIAAPPGAATINEDFLELLDQMEQQYRVVLILYYVEEMSIREISQILQMNENTVKTRLSRGRGVYKKLYLKEHPEFQFE